MSFHSEREDGRGEREGRQNEREDGRGEREDRHARKVAAVAEQLKELSSRAAARQEGARGEDEEQGGEEAAGEGAGLSLRKGSVPHLVPDPRDPRYSSPKIDIGALNRVLEIDEREMTCTAESAVTFADLVTATLEMGLVPIVVPELKGITVGGAVSGCSIESMSYRHGGFHDTCLEYEIVTGDGRILECSREQNPEIFEMIHGSYGTLGILTRIRFRLIPAKPYVRMRYTTLRDIEGYWLYLKEICDEGRHDFVDGIIHGPSHLTACQGDMVDEAPYLSDYTGTEVFYRSTAEREQDYLTLSDYFFRYDAECHWLTRTIPGLGSLAEARLFRRLFGRFYLGSTRLIGLSRRFRRFLDLKRRPDVVVDVFLPSKRFVEFFRWYVRDFDFYPLWVVPYRMKELYPWISGRMRRRIGDERFFIDCAVYGRRNDDPRVDYSELIERKVYELGGLKTLISRNHYDEETFWRIYNRPLYERVKAETDPQGLFDGLYRKTHPHA